MTAAIRSSSSWALLRSVLLVYGITFLAGVLFAFQGITPTTDRALYPLLALLAQGVGVALALRLAKTTALSYLVALTVGIWLLSSTSVWLGAQSFLAWFDSLTFIAATVVVGRVLVGPHGHTAGTTLRHSRPQSV